MNIFNIKDKMDYLKEVIELEHNEWAQNPLYNYDDRVNNKIKNTIEKLNRTDFCKLILLDNKTLIGFISIFPSDEENHQELTPWYATMYVKKEFRKKRILKNTK